MNSITSFIKRFPQPVFWAIAWSTFFFGYFMYLRTSSDSWQFLILGPFLGGNAAACGAAFCRHEQHL